LKGRIRREKKEQAGLLIAVYVFGYNWFFPIVIQALVYIYPRRILLHLYAWPLRVFSFATRKKTLPVILMYRNYSLDSRKSLLFVIGSSSFIFILFQEFFRGELEKLKKKKVFTAVVFQLKAHHLRV
jgi:hypothetical protein